LFSTASASAASRWKIPRPSPVLRFSVSERLLRLKAWKSVCVKLENGAYEENKKFNFFEEFREVLREYF
jgi:hypothetical protein